MLALRRGRARCNLVFYCSQELREDVDFEIAVACQCAKGDLFIWVPNMVGSVWTSVSGTMWQLEFADELKNCIPLGAPHHYPRASALSRSLTLPMTILYAHENLNDGTGWTLNETLTIRVSNRLCTVCFRLTRGGRTESP
jgi:hypothetical protein